MESKLITSGKNRFLRISCGMETVSGFELKMISNNQPELLLRIHSAAENGENYLDYNVSGMVSLKDCEEDPEMPEYLYKIVFSLEHLADVLAAHLLSEEDVVSDPSMIFLRKETGRVFFCFLPKQGKPVSEILGEITEFFMKRLDLPDEKDVLLLYGLYQKSRENNVTLRSLAEYWRESRGKTAIQKEEANRAYYPMENALREMLPAEELQREVPLKKGYNEEADMQKTAVIRSEEEEAKRQQADAAIYEQIGLNLPKLKEFSLPWKRKQEEEPEELPIEFPRNEAIIDPSGYSRGPDEEDVVLPESAAGHRFMKAVNDHIFEIGVGTLVVLGALVILLS